MSPDASSRVVWRKSSRSSASGSDCVEVAVVRRGIAVRDSKHPRDGHLVVGRDGWRALVAGVKAGHFNAR